VIRLQGASLAVRDDAGHPRTLLHPTDLSLAPGERRLILGANGSGKTSLLRLMAGLTPPSSGSVLVDDVPIHGPAARGAGHSWGGAASLWPRVAVVFEEPDPQFLAETVEAEIAFGLESMALPAHETRERVAAALEAHGLAALAARDPRTLSAGEKTRTLLAAALAARPTALLLDQCFAHLDPAARRAEEIGIATEARGGKLGVLRASQEQDSAPGERLHWLDQGVLRDVAQLTPAAVLAARAAPLPLALRTSAALALDGRWSGPLTASVGEFLAALERMEPAGGTRYTARGHAPAERVAPAGGGAPLLALRGVAWAPTRRSAPVVEDVSFEVGAGEVVALVGASGAGKSTLLHLAAGLRAPTSGTVERALPAVKRTPGVMLALEYPERQLFARSVAEDVAASLWIEGVPAEERARRAARALREVDLDPERFADRVPGTLSEGEKRRAALASFLIDPPLVLLWDEPTAGLDPEGRRALRVCLAKLRERGRAVLLASHDLDFVTGTADRVLVLGRDAGAPGRLLGGGNPDAVWRDDALLSRAGLPAPEAFVLARALEECGWLPPGATSDGDSLVLALSRAVAPLSG
jgi:energy-coupling factor transport system ATP-binding protein